MHFSTYVYTILRLYSFDADVILTYYSGSHLVKWRQCCKPVKITASCGSIKILQGGFSLGYPCRRSLCIFDCVDQF